MAIQIKKILVPLDGSTNSFRGLDVAIQMARESHATITGLYVAGIVKPRTNDPITSLEKILLGHAQKIMKKATTKHRYLAEGSCLQQPQQFSSTLKYIQNAASIRARETAQC